MEVITIEEEITSLVGAYRTLKMSVDGLKSRMDEVKKLLQPMLDAEGEWKDDDGYARIVVRKPSPGYDTKAVLLLEEMWLLSPDEMMQSCGRLLSKKRKDQAGSTFVQIK